METFAKIIETPTTQVLYYVDYDPDDDMTVLHQIIRTSDGITADVAARFDGTNQEKAQRALARMEEVDALKAVEMVERILSAPAETAHEPEDSR